MRPASEPRKRAIVLSWTSNRVRRAKTVWPPAVYHDAGAGGFDQHVGAQRRDREIGVFLLAFIDSTRRSGYYFKDDDRLILKMAAARIWPANDRCIAIIKSRVISMSNPDLVSELYGRKGRP